MVRALHEADIEVMLDVVYNHTAEAGPDGPTYSYRGIDNSTYYLMSDDPRASTATTPAAATRWPAPAAAPDDDPREPALLGDGDARRRLPFRPGLGAGPRRRRHARDRGYSLLAAIRTDPVLRHVHLIAEPWDAGWAYQLGTQFPGPGWCQWNSRFRDDVRRFVRGDPGMVGALMQRLYGSDDLFPDDPRDAHRPFRASTTSPATTASPSTTWSPTTRNTTGPTATATPTGPPRT